MLRRAVAVAGLSLVILGGGAIPAFADGGWGTVQCDQNPHPGCELGAGSGGKHSTPSHGSGGTSSGNGSTGGSGSSGGSGREETKNPNPDLNLADCSYQRSDYTSPPGVVQTAYVSPSKGGVAVAQPAVYSSAAPSAVVPAAEPKAGESGAWYVYKCTAGGVRDAVYRPPVWIPNAPQQGGGAPQPTPAQLAQTARDQLRLPSPQIQANPAGEQLVDLPTWLWLDRGGWGRVSATASVPGVSVTAMARPMSVVWTMGDGSSVTCTGAGTPYGSSGNPERSSPDCGHVYRSSSAGQPGSAFAVAATVHWMVTWAGAGQTGTFPDMTTTSNAAFRVAESQALNNGG
jgi:hypothetical protein